MALATITRSVMVFCFLLGTAFRVDAIRSLTEDELDQTMAGGIEVRIVDDETETVEVERPDLFFNQIFGQNEVITRLVVEIVSSMDHFSFMQENQIAQDGELCDIGALAQQTKNVVFLVGGPQDTDGSKFIAVNNVAGKNEVETVINVTFFVPVGQGVAVGGYNNPFASGGPGSTPTAAATNNPTVTPTAAIPTSAPQNNLPQFARPTTLGGAASLMQGLAQQHPEAAPGLQQGISTVQSFQK